MTKLRHPLTFENALLKVAGHIGWAAAAKIVGRAENTVRNWSDGDTTSGVTLDAALKLDVEYHKAGGTDPAPFLLCYATLVDAQCIAANPEIQALLDGAAKSAKESGEAIDAVIKAAKSRSNLGEIAIAERELEEAISAHTNSLAALHAWRKALLDQGKKEPGKPARVQEVAPPMQTA